MVIFKNGGDLVRFVNVSTSIINEMLARPIINNKGQILMSRDTSITENIIKKLQKLGIRSVYIRSQISSELEDVIDVTERKTATLEFKKFADGLYKNVTKAESLSVNKRIKTHNNLNKQIDIIANNLMKNVNYSKKMAIVDIKSTEDYLFEHQVSVCILSIYLARKFGLNNKDIKKLAKAALIFDYGNFLLKDKSILSKKELTKNERKEMEKHTVLGYDFFRKFTDFSITETIPTLEHHEKIDGSGYPRGITGDKMHIFSKIIAIADSYDALTSDRVYRKAYSQSEAIELLMGSAGMLYDFELTNLFVKNIIPYPRGSKVILSNNDIGFVINQNRDLPLRPKIIVISQTNKRYIDLAKDMSITIKHVLMT